MKLVNLNCPSCSGELDINEEKRIATCKYCGTRWYIEDDNYTRLSRLEQRVNNLEREQEKRTQTQTYANRTATSGYSGNVPRMPASKLNQTDHRAGGNALSLFLVILMAIGYGYVSSLDHSGSSPMLSALISGFLMAIFATGVYLKFHRNPRNVNFGMTFLFMFMVFFFLALL